MLMLCFTTGAEQGRHHGLCPCATLSLLPPSQPRDGGAAGQEVGAAVLAAGRGRKIADEKHLMDFNSVI